MTEKGKEKKHSLAWWKKKAKSKIQLWVRLEESNAYGICTCITCGVKKHYKKMNGGHFIPAEWLATCFIEQNIHAQCPRCNKFLGGNWVKYYDYMVDRYGKENVESLLAQKHLNIKYSYIDYQEIIDIYSDKINGLAIQKGLL